MGVRLLNYSKRDGSICGRSTTEGRKQCGQQLPEEATQFSFLFITHNVSI